LYEGLTREERAWLAYDDPDTMFPMVFNPFNDALDTDHEVKMVLVTPRAIPVNFFGSGKTFIQTYEFYNPSALACQLAFGRLPIALCYANVIKPRETITSLLEWIRVAQLPSSANTDVDLSEWVPAAFITQAYKQWWAEWKEHLFCRSALTYRGMIDPEYKVPDDTVSIFELMFQFYHFYFHRRFTFASSCRLTTPLHRSAGVASRLTYFHQAQSPQSATTLLPWPPSCIEVYASRRSPLGGLRYLHR